MSMLELGRALAPPPGEGTLSIAIAVVAAVRPEVAGDVKSRLVVDCINPVSRAVYLGCLVGGAAGARWQHQHDYPQATTQNMATGVTFDADRHKRLIQMQTDIRPSGWDGDLVLLVHGMAERAVIACWLAHGRAFDDVDPNDLNATVAVGEPLGDVSSDPTYVPTGNANSWPDQHLYRHGRLLMSAWLDRGMAAEVREHDVETDRLTSRATSRVVFTDGLVLLRSSDVQVESGSLPDAGDWVRSTRMRLQGGVALIEADEYAGVDAGDGPGLRVTTEGGGDAVGDEYARVARAPELLDVLVTMQAQIDELQAAYGDLKARCAAISGDGVKVNTTGLAATLAKPAPTDAQKSAIPSTQVRAGS